MNFKNTDLLIASAGENQDASVLISTLTNEATRPAGAGSMSTSIYGSAWVSMVFRTTISGSHWIFPECLQYILDAQSPDGGWEPYASQVDGILNTAAALLALVCHNSSDLNERNQNLYSTIQNRISVAEISLGSQLQKWDVDACDHVGFEVLVPAMLSYIEAKIGSEFNFPSKESLLRLNRNKLFGFRPEMMYGKSQMTTLHTLEAFVVKLDFDRIACHKVNGAILGSPAATSAYLMNCTTWDHEAESYLRTVVTEGAGKGGGGVPCAFPTTIFETAWVLSTLLKSGFTAKTLGAYNLETLSSILELEFHQQNGTVGFAPSLLPDEDDAAKTIVTLCLLGKPASLDQMISKFEGESHFRTYVNEKTSSFSANCNVLDALLHVEKPEKYEKQILKTAEFLCKAWSADNVSDKWNLSRQYSMMLLAQTFRKLIALWDMGSLPGLPLVLISEQIPLVMIQVLHRTLHWQNLEGSWAGSNCQAPCEITSYTVLTLVAASQMPWTGELDSQASKAIKKGNEFLQINEARWGDITYTWVEKVTYGSSVLSKTYCLAASKSATTYANATHSFSAKTQAFFNISPDKISGYAKFFSQLPLFQNQESWKIRASLVEAQFFFPRLQRSRLNIFPRENMTKDKYLEYIPFTWTGCNNEGAFLRSDLLWDMMMISMLNYQVDEYMETVAGVQFPGDLDTIEPVIRSLFTHGISPKFSNGFLNEDGPGHQTQNSLPSNGSNNGYGQAYGDKTADNKSSDSVLSVGLRGGGAGCQQKTTDDNSPHSSLTNGSSNGEGPVHRTKEDDDKSSDSSPTNGTSNGDKPGHSTKTNGSHNVGKPPHQAIITENKSITASLQTIKSTLSKFATYILLHPSIASLSPPSQLRLSLQLEAFLVGHHTHSTDNILFSKQPLFPSPSNIPQQTSPTTTPTFPTTHPFHTWVRTTASTHTSCPYSFTYITCAMEAHSGLSPFPTPVTKYLAQELVTHLSTMCRMYNDYGSLARGREEGNVNCVNFPEFEFAYLNGTGREKAGENGGDGNGESDLEKRKRELFELAEYERSCMVAVKEKLFPLLREEVSLILGVFVEVTDLYGQIYVARDIASRM